MLGHASVAFTLATYGHVQAEMRKPARDAMERLFGGVFQPMGGSVGAKAKIPARASPTRPEFKGQVGQESNLQPAVLETQSDVSRGVGRHRQMPLCPHHLCRLLPPNVAMCRRSLGHLLGQPMLPRRSFPCVESPIRAHHHLRYGLIRQLVLEPRIIQS
jgi:hypothetical protein